jgi:hypothetical protein
VSEAWNADWRARKAPFITSAAAGPRFAGQLAVARSFSMPFPLIPTALGLCFLLIWVFIGGMIFRDSQLAARCDREIDGNILPLRASRLTHGVVAPKQSKVKRRNSAVRAAS